METFLKRENSKFEIRNSKRWVALETSAVMY